MKKIWTERLKKAIDLNNYAYHLRVGRGDFFNKKIFPLLSEVGVKEVCVHTTHRGNYLTCSRYRNTSAGWEVFAGENRPFHWVFPNIYEFFGSQGKGVTEEDLEVFEVVHPRETQDLIRFYTGNFIQLEAASNYLAGEIRCGITVEYDGDI